MAEWGNSFGRWDTTLKLLPITTNQRNIQHRCACVHVHACLCVCVRVCVRVCVCWDVNTKGHTEWYVHTYVHTFGPCRYPPRPSLDLNTPECEGVLCFTRVSLTEY